MSASAGRAYQMVTRSSGRIHMPESSVISGNAS